MSRAVLAFGGLRVLAEAASGHLEWLEEFLGTAFERADGHEADWRVSLVEDRNRYRQALDRGPADGTLEAFAFDAKVVGLPRWRTQAGDTGLVDAVRGLHFEVAYASHAVTLLTEPGNADGRIALMRVVRELSMNRAQRRGGLLLHAAAMAVGDRGIVITGPKGAGKTSLLIHALRARSARYVSNDRVVVPAADGRPTATGVPTIVALRRGTLDLFPSLASRAAASGYAYRLTLDEALAAGPRAPESGGKPDSLSPAQFCRLLDVRPVACSEIAAIVFPRITGEPGTFALRRLTEAEVVEKIPDMLFGVRGGRFVSNVFADPADPPPDLGALAERCRDIASRVPCVECRLGLDVFAAAAAADDLIAAILRIDPVPLTTRRRPLPC